MKPDLLLAEKKIVNLIFNLRNEKVMIDSDIAEIFGVTTKLLNRAVKRNIDRFPPDFMFQLTKEEKDDLIANCEHLQKLKFSPNLPYAFTEHGTVMLASILNSPVAVQASIQVVRAFIKLREILSTHKELSAKFELLENKIEKHDKDIAVIFQAIRQLMQPEKKERKEVGYLADKK